MSWKLISANQSWVFNNIVDQWEGRKQEEQHYATPGGYFGNIFTGREPLSRQARVSTSLNKSPVKASRPTLHHFKEDRIFKFYPSIFLMSTFYIKVSKLFYQFELKDYFVSSAFHRYFLYPSIQKISVKSRWNELKFVKSHYYNAHMMYFSYFWIFRIRTAHIALCKWVALNWKFMKS